MMDNVTESDATLNHPNLDKPSATGEIASPEGSLHSGLARLTNRRAALAIVGVVMLFAVPTFLGVFAVSVMTHIFTFAVLTGSLVLLMGTAGMPSIGQAAYFGVGGYAAGLVAQHVTLSAPLLLLVAAAAGLVVAAATGWLLVRSRASYFLMLTLAIGEIIASVANSWSGLTGGSDGMTIPTLAIGSINLDVAGYIYWYTLVATLVLLGLLGLLRRSPFGLALRGIRDNEARMRALGYATGVYKYVAFCLAGAVAGAAGALLVTQVRFVSPADLGFGTSALVLVAVIIGGADSLVGGVVGAVVVIAVQNFLPASWEGHGPLVLGLLLIAAVYLLRGGVAALPQRLHALKRGAR